MTGIHIQIRMRNREAAEAFTKDAPEGVEATRYEAEMLSAEEMAFDLVRAVIVKTTSDQLSKVVEWLLTLRKVEDRHGGGQPHVEIDGSYAPLDSAALLRVLQEKSKRRADQATRPPSGK